MIIIACIDFATTVALAATELLVTGYLMRARMCSVIISYAARAKPTSKQSSVSHNTTLIMILLLLVS
jgi:hypothetical protein